MNIIYIWLSFIFNYRKFRDDSSFNARAIVETRTVRDAEDCARECDYYRDSGRYMCNAFAISPISYRDNCILTDSYGRDIESDVVYSRDYTVYEHSGGSGTCRQNTEVGLSVLGVGELYFK